MNSRVAPFEGWLFAAVLLAVMFLAMWAQRPTPTCMMPPEAPRQLILSRDVDREHLSRDRAVASRIELRYRASIPESAQQQSRLDACEATLVRQIVTTHGVTAGQVTLSAPAIPQTSAGSRFEQP
jgi:hypothetical protein